MKESVKKIVSVALSCALLMLSAGVEPYSAFAQVIKPGLVEPAAPSGSFDGQSGLGASEDAVPVSAETSLGSQETLSQAPVSEASRQSREAALVSERGLAQSVQTRVAETRKETARGGDGSAPLTRLFDHKGGRPADSVGGIAEPATLSAPEQAEGPSVVSISGSGLGAAPDSSESIPPAEAQLHKVSVSYALEAVLEDIPEGRVKIVGLLADENIPAAAREAYFTQFVARLQEAAGREGVPADMFPIAKQFLSEIEASQTTPQIQSWASQQKDDIGRPSPIQQIALQAAVGKGLSVPDAALSAAIAVKDARLSARYGYFSDVQAAAAGLRAAGIQPTATITRDILRSASTAAWLDKLTFGRLRSWKLSKAVGRAANLKKALETREPDLFSDKEIDVYYSVLSSRIDIKNSGYYGYRKRVDAARSFVRDAGLEKTRKPLVPAFTLKNAYQPFDASGVDRSVILRNRARIAGAHKKISTLAALEDPRLAGLREEIVRRTWGYVQLWPEKEKDPSSKDAQGRAIPLPSKQIRGFVAKVTVPTAQMEKELKGAGRYLFVGLHASLIYLLSSLPPAKKKEGQVKEVADQRQAIHELLAENMLAYQWTDDVARAELNIGDDPSAWQPIEIRLALDRLGYIYYDKSNEFQAFKTGLFVPDEVRAIMSAGRKEARDQVDNIIVNKGTGKDETIEFVQADGVDGLFRGFCGRDCNKSLAPERGRLAVRSYQPYTSSYLGMVDGKAVGFLTLFEAVKEGKKVLLAELVQFPERESMTPKLLEKLDALAKANGYVGVAVTSNLHPWDPVAKETASNFTNFHQTIKAVKAMKAWQDGETFKPEFPWAADWAKLDSLLGRVPYYSWGIADGTYKLLKFEQASASAASETGPPASPKAGKLPASFYTFLAGLSLTAMAQEAIAVMAPIYAAGTEGLGFAVLVQAVGQVFRIPGATIGAKVARRFDSKKVYIFGILLNAAAFFSIPASYFLHVPSFWIKGLFLAFSAVGGLVYGATRGVAENEMPPRIIGQDHPELLEKAGSLSFAVVEPAAFAAAFGIVGLQAAFGNHASAVISGALLAASSIPFFFIKYKQKSLHAEEPTGAGSEDKLPIKTYLPYVFFNFIHQSFYSLFAWSIAMEVLHKEALNGSLTGLYDIGSFAIAALLTFLPKLLPKWSEKQWTWAAMLPVLGFLWGSLMLGRPLVSLGAAALLGASTTIANVKWKKIYQTRLKLDKQAGVFQWLMISAVLASLLPFLVVSGGTAIGVHISITTALFIISTGVTAVGALMLWLIRK